MHILFLIDKMTPGGTQRHVMRLSRNFKRAGHQITLCCLESPGCWGDRLNTEGFPVYSLGCSSILWGKGFSALAKLTKLLKVVQPDILHTLLFSANVIGPLAARFSGCGCRVVSARRDIGFHLSLRHFLFLRIANCFTDQLLANARGVIKHRAQQEHQSPSAFTLIPNGIETIPPPSMKLQRDQLNIPKDDLILLCVARLRPEKGQARVLEIMAALLRQTGAILLLAGDGPEEASLKQLAARLGIEEKVHFLGHRDDIPALLNLADVMILLSEHEGCSNAILEAMNSGTPVIASAIAGNEEIIEDQKNGWLFPADTDLAIVEKLHALAEDPASRNQIGRLASQRVNQLFTDKREWQSTLAVYQKLIPTTTSSQHGDEKNDTASL